MDKPHEIYDVKLAELIEEATAHPADSDEARKAMSTLKTFSECRPPAPIQELELEPEPTTVWGKTKSLVARVYESETTRVVVKTFGSVASVGVVVYATVKRDHALDRNALNQANQQPR
jgi:hypothetical protein